VDWYSYGGDSAYNNHRRNIKNRTNGEDFNTNLLTRLEHNYLDVS